MGVDPQDPRIITAKIKELVEVLQDPATFKNPQMVKEVRRAIKDLQHRLARLMKPDGPT